MEVTMAGTFWDDLKKNVKKGFNVAAEKTKEYTQIGKLEIDILNLKRSVDKAMTELGRESYKIYKSGKQGDISKDEKVVAVIKKIDSIYKDIKSKEKEVEAIKAEEQKKKPEKEAEVVNTKKKAEPSQANKQPAVKKPAAVKKTPAAKKKEPAASRQAKKTDETKK